MDDWKIKKIDINNKILYHEVKNLLLKVHLKTDNIDYCLGITNEKHQLIATISKFANTIKCLAVEPKYQNENIANSLITSMIKVINNQGWEEVFVFAKPNVVPLFMHLGFYSVLQEQNITFLTNRIDLITDYSNYLTKLSKNLKTDNNAVVIMNANPFSIGHLDLVTNACKERDYVFVIVVKENSSFFTYDQRFAMVENGLKNISNVKVISGSNFLITKGVFPSYFIKSKKLAIKTESRVDASIFANIVAPNLKSTYRYVGEEPFSKTTDLYNLTLKTVLNEHQIHLIVKKRKTYDGIAISATKIRLLYANNDFKELANLVPFTTLQYLQNLAKTKYTNNKKLINKKN